MLKKLKPYIISLLFTFAIALFSNFVVGESTSMYDTIAKPALSPPPYVFGIVWPILYTLMAIGAGLVYTTECVTSKCTERKQSAILLYVVQLIVNGIWPILFFRFELFTLAFLCIVVLWLLILKMVYDFYKINKVAGYLIVPYLLWVTFATYLNLMIARLN